MTGIINGFEQRIVALSGVEKSTEGPLTFHLQGDPFITDVTADSLKLHMTDVCLAKLESALKAENRVTNMDLKNHTVSFKFTDDVDKEFVFLYIRFAWKHKRTKVEAA